jgi:hypothetical protein
LKELKIIDENEENSDLQEKLKTYIQLDETELENEINTDSDSNED